MSTQQTTQRVSTPIVEYVNAGQTVATFNVVHEMRGDDLYIYYETVPVTRVKGGLPDWPQAISLKPDPDSRKN